jgi:hypothetical protein
MTEAKTLKAQGRLAEEKAQTDLVGPVCAP